MQGAARGRVVRPGLAWMRLLLLASLLLGVAAMHTLGHTSKDADHVAPTSTASVVAHVDPASETHDQSAVTDPTTMCLAIVSMVTALVGLAAVAFVPWPGPLLRPPPSLRRSVVRSAPHEPPSLARLQVLRV